MKNKRCLFRIIVDFYKVFFKFLGLCVFLIVKFLDFGNLRWFINYILFIIVNRV